MQKVFLLILLSVSISAQAQDPILTVGSHFPDMWIIQMSNAPIKEFRFNKPDGKFYILNFWGTWCSPCIPEMDSLALLQKQNSGQLQVIAISDDDEIRKTNYLKKKPSGIWLATDTNYTLYKMLNLAAVGQSAILNPERKIVALVRTDSINQLMIDRLFRGDSIAMTAHVKMPMIEEQGDPFGVDSLMTHSATLRGYKQGQQSMGKQYRLGAFEGRRLSWFNVSLGTLYRSAFGIKTYRIQERYEGAVTEKEVDHFEDKSTLYCVDFLVPNGKQESLYPLLRQFLQQNLPIKARLDKEWMEVYVLKIKKGAHPEIKASMAGQTEKSFSGKGYSGIRVTVTDFAEDYLTNELGIPVIDETGLKGFYDIKTRVELRNKQGILNSIEALGFEVEKAKREMPVLIYHR